MQDYDELAHYAELGKEFLEACDVEDELAHHGIKGQKWGVRRYQNKDGSYTDAGLKRHGRVGDWAKRKAKQAKAAIDKASASRKAKKQAEKDARRESDILSGKIPAKKMTEAELKKRIARLETERQYATLIKDNYGGNTNRGSRFINKFVDATLDKIADNVLADLVGQTLKSYAAKGINKAAKSEIVYANNKKKN